MVDIITVLMVLVKENVVTVDTTLKTSFNTDNHLRVDEKTFLLHY